MPVALIRSIALVMRSTLSRWIASRMLYSVSTTIARADQTGCFGVIVARSSESAIFFSRKARQVSPAALLVGLQASGSLKSGSRVVILANQPLLAVRARWKLVW